MMLFSQRIKLKFKLNWNKRLIFFLIGSVLLVLGLILGWNYYQQRRELQTDDPQQSALNKIKVETKEENKDLGSGKSKSLLGDLLNSSYQGVTFYSQATPIEDESENRVEEDGGEIVKNQAAATKIDSGQNQTDLDSQQKEKLEREKLAQKQQEQSSTGATYLLPPADVLAVADQVGDLKNQAPLTTDFFSLKFNYTSRKFEVDLTYDTEQVVNDFYSWLDTNNYNLIPHERFEFK